MYICHGFGVLFLFSENYFSDILLSHASLYPVAALAQSEKNQLLGKGSCECSVVHVTVLTFSVDVTNENLLDKQ